MFCVDGTMDTKGLTGVLGDKWGDSMDDFDYDYCYECRGYGDDYYVNEDGELVCRCDDCSYSESNWKDDWY